MVYCVPLGKTRASVNRPELLKCMCTVASTCAVCTALLSTVSWCYFLFRICPICAVSGIATVAVRSLLASGMELFVGATNGVVGVYSAETGDFLRRFMYHTGDVRALLEIPLLTTPCVCAEVQTADVLNMGAISSIMDTPIHGPSFSSLKPGGEDVSLHKQPNPQEPLKPLILSIGNGHLEMRLAHPTGGAEEQLMASLGESPKLVAKGGQAPIYLQCWGR